MLSSATPPPTPQCHYTVTPVQYGFQINITSSTIGNYTIKIKEEGQPEKKFNHQHSTPVSSYEVKFLKPCTEYEHRVAFVDHTGGETACNSTEDKTTTTGMNRDDIKEVSCTPGYVCYHSDWDISTSLSASNNIPAEPCKNDQTIFCIKPGFNDICSDLTTTFTCGTSSYTLTKSISVDFLNPSEINQEAPTKLPAEIKTTLPPNCKNLAVDYTCQEDGKLNKVKNLSELEPFTQYSCTGQIKQNNVSIQNKETPAIVFTVDCDLDISHITNVKSTDTSIQLSWTKTSTNCPDPHLKDLSYVCSCSSSSHNGPTHSQSCSVSGLKPYTDYTCKVQPTYNNKNVGQPEQVKQKTAAGNNHKAVIGSLVFLGILTAVSLVMYKVYIYILRRRESMNEVSEGVMLQSSAIYANVPQYEYRRKDAR